MFGLRCFFLFVCFFDIELHELLVKFGNVSFVSCIICKYFLLVVGGLFVFFMVSFAVQKLNKFD